MAKTGRRRCPLVPSSCFGFPVVFGVLLLKSIYIYIIYIYMVLYGYTVIPSIYNVKKHLYDVCTIYAPCTYHVHTIGGFLKWGGPKSHETILTMVTMVTWGSPMFETPTAYNHLHTIDIPLTCHLLSMCLPFTTYLHTCTISYHAYAIYIPFTYRLYTIYIPFTYRLLHLHTICIPSIYHLNTIQLRLFTHHLYTIYIHVICTILEVS